MMMMMMIEEHHWGRERRCIDILFFSHKSKENENAFNHIQTIAADKKNKTRRKERQRSFGNCHHWLIVGTMKSNHDENEKFIH